MGNIGCLNYAASKAGITTLIILLKSAGEVAACGVQGQCTPGFLTESDMTDAIPEKNERCHASSRHNETNWSS